MDDELSIKIPLQGDVTPIEKALSTMKEKVSGAMSAVRDAMGAVGLMADGYLKGAIENAVKAQESTDMLKDKLENQGISWDKAKGQVDAFTAGVKAMSTHSGGEAKEALDNLITRNVSLADAMKMQAPITELAAARNMSLKDASDLLANAENGRWGGLIKLGIVTKDQVKDGISMTDVLGKINDKYKGLSEDQMKTLPGQIDLVNRNFKDFTTSIGTALLPMITNVATIIEKLSEHIKEISPATKTIIADVLLATATLGPLVGGLGLAQKIMGILGPVVTGLGGLIGGLTLPIIAVVAGIAALTLAFVNNWGGIRTKTEEFIAYIKPILINTFDNIVKWFKDNWPMIKEKCNEVFTGIQTVYNTVLKPVIDFMLAIFKQLIDWVVANWPLIQKTITTILNAVWNVIKSVLNTIKDFWDTWGKTIMDYVTMCFNNIKIVIQTVIKVIEDIITVAMDLITGNWKGAWNGLIKIVKDIFGGVGAIVQNILDGIGKIFADMINVAFNWGKNLIDGFVKGIESMASAAANAAGNVVKSIKGFLGFNSPSEKGEGQHIIEWGANMINGFMDGIKSKLPDMQSLMNTAMKAPELSSNLNMTVNGGTQKASQNSQDSTISQSGQSGSASTNSAGNNITQNITLNSPKALNPSETTRQFRSATQQLALQW